MAIPRPARVGIIVLVVVFIFYKLLTFDTGSNSITDIRHSPVRYDVTDGIIGQGKSLEKPLASSAANLANSAANRANEAVEATKQTVNGRLAGTGASLSNMINTKPRVNATFVTLARNSDLFEIIKSIRNVEDRFNGKYNYPWVFLNDVPFDDEFKRVTSALTSGKAEYGVIGKDHWGFPDFIDQEKAAAVRKDMGERKIIYGDSESYRYMCRYESGFFYRHELMLKYEYYWRVEPSIEMFCDVDYDPFLFMKENDKVYGFAISLYEYQETIPTLWDKTKEFMKANPELMPKDNALDWVSDDKGETYNRCHFWSNFEIGKLDFWREGAYAKYFDHLDKSGGFFYERWGDAPVHSIGAALFARKDQIHFFSDMGYYHVPFTHCPVEPAARERCHCNPRDSFDWRGYSCTGKWYDVNGLKKPANWEQYKD